MKRIARKHHFNVLLHEKPYSGVNGSGKHNNWSLCTDTGINLFAPGKNPKGNMLFLTFLVNALMMVYKNQDLLRASIMSASNSYRLGANEAPPAILSCFLGSTPDKLVTLTGIVLLAIASILVSHSLIKAIFLLGTRMKLINGLTF